MTVEYKDLTALAGRRLSPQEAWQLASPAQRRLWFGDEPPTKAASQYELPPAAPVGLPAHLEQAVRDHQLGHYADPVCAQCKSAYALGGGTFNGRCKHRPNPAQLAERRSWERKAYATRLTQQLAAGHFGGDTVRVVDVSQATAEDALKAELHAMIDGLY